ncbi:MAG: flagellar biosynthesis anti-sigma factor FlgM [Oxalobacteraceae bacterium]|jgi:negative regulator of flagellin synthesis FlgM|nr:flagellar biosynthesis anti-sigma factor FlgM [Oxalobacteraceae bacterium]
MSNPISSIFSGSAALDKVALEKTKRRALERSGDGQPEASTAAKPTAPTGDTLHLSEVAKRASAEPSFDREKVEAIKQALRDGNYPMNARRIAESFVAIEKLID